MDRHIPTDGAERARLRAVVISLALGALLLAAKYQAYRLTGSTAILSDALESIVNVVAAVFALGGILFAGRPADRNHPYGHGKIEFFSAAFEGGLIAFAAVLIVYEVIQSLWRGVELRALDVGLAIVLGAGLHWSTAWLRRSQIFGMLSAKRGQRRAGGCYAERAG